MSRASSAIQRGAGVERNRSSTRRRAQALAAAIVLAATAAAGHATSSSTLWTNMTPDIQAFGVFHLGVDNYFTVGRRAADGGGDFPTDVGLTVGILPFEKFQMEIGVDLLEPTDHPLSGNIKLGAPEGALGPGAPALYVGMFGLGTETGVTDYNVAYLTIARTIRGFGRVAAGPYLGNDRLLRSSKGEKQDTGFMVAFDRGFRPVSDAAGNTFNRFVLAADYASGDNAIGGASAGLYAYFTKDIDLAVAPVWFNDEGVNGKWKLTVQLDVNLPGLTR